MIINFQWDWTEHHCTWLLSNKVWFPWTPTNTGNWKTKGMLYNWENRKKIRISLWFVFLSILFVLWCTFYQIVNENIVYTSWSWISFLYSNILLSLVILITCIVVTIVNAFNAVLVFQFYKGGNFFQWFMSLLVLTCSILTPYNWQYCGQLETSVSCIAADISFQMILVLPVV